MVAHNPIPKVLMIGPGRNVMGGISTVVNFYYDLGLDQQVELHFISSMEDGSKLKKLCVAARAYMECLLCVHKYDIVHIHMAAQASFSRKAIFVRLAKLAGKQVIIHQHAGDFDDFYLRQSTEKKRNQIRSVFAAADKIITLSEEWADFFGSHVCDPEKILVLYNGVLMPAYQKVDYTDHNVLFLGRLCERKGIYDLLEAIPSVLKRVPDTMFYLGGDGDVEQCKQIAVENGFADHTVFLGWVRAEDKEHYLEKCSAFILPSYFEGMPMSLLEAMSYGLATVSTNVGGIPQVIENGVSGIRIDAGEVPKIADVLTDLLSDPEKKRSLGETAVQRIKTSFNAEENLGVLVKLYSRMVSEEK